MNNILAKARIAEKIEQDEKKSNTKKESQVDAIVMDGACF